MTKETEERLARSLTAESTDLLPFLPYLLQDLWKLGSNPGDIIARIKNHMRLSKDTRILDLACGKGAVSVQIAEGLGVSVYGVDLIHDFIAYANRKANERNVRSLCRFACGDANETAATERDYDCVIFGAAGNILGNPQETLGKLIKTVKPGGYIILDEAYLPDDSSNDMVKYKNYEYLTHEQWIRLFSDNGLTLVEEVPNREGYDFDSDNKNIALRADELIARYPEKRSLFMEYIQSQLNECDDLESNVMGVTWMLRTLQR